MSPGQRPMVSTGLPWIGWRRWRIKRKVRKNWKHFWSVWDTRALSRPAQQDLRLTVLSDTHQLHRELDDLPGGDLLIHCGDFSFFSRSYAAIQDFALWLAEQPYRDKIVCFGNHEFAFEADPRRRSVFENEGVIVLVNEGVEIQGLRIWGSPVTPLYGGAFGVSSDLERARHWRGIPADTDVLITHGPPYGILDRSPTHSPGQQQSQGDPQLLQAVQTVHPLLHCFGHIHGAYGVAEQNGTTYLNAALLGLAGDLAYPPVHMRFPRGRFVTSNRSS